MLQAGFLWWQANILRRHAATLERHTDIAGTQAQTANLIGQALNQQGRVLDEQTKIMAKQFELQRRVETKVERNSLFTSAVDMQGALVSLDRRLSRILLSNVTQKDNDEVARYFETLNQNATACMKELMTAVHISKEEKQYFSNYSRKLSDLEYTGDVRKTLEDVKAIRATTTEQLFYAKLGELAKTPQLNQSDGD